MSEEIKLIAIVDYCDLYKGCQFKTPEEKEKFVAKFNKISEHILKLRKELKR